MGAPEILGALQGAQVIVVCVVVLFPKSWHPAFAYPSAVRGGEWKKRQCECEGSWGRGGRGVLTNLRQSSIFAKGIFHGLN